MGHKLATVCTTTTAITEGSAPPPQAPMLVRCSALGCEFTMPPRASNFKIILESLALHVRLANPMATATPSTTLSLQPTWTADEESYNTMEPLPNEGVHKDLLKVPSATGGLLDGLRKPSRPCPPVANPALNSEFHEGKRNLPNGCLITAIHRLVLLVAAGELQPSA